MAIYAFSENTLDLVTPTTFRDENILERQNIQAALKKRIEAIDPQCLVISEEFSEWSTSARRIDLLAVDREGKLVVIELKRNETGDQMELQALRYAAMVSTLTFARAVEIYQKFIDKNSLGLNAQDQLLSFLGWELPQEDKFALDVRIILISADFSSELTTSVIWLNEREIDIRCVRITPYLHLGKLLIDFQQIIPLPEAEDYQIKIRQQSETRRDARRLDKDYATYLFEGNEYNKRKLVLAVVKFWFNQYSPKTPADFLAAFPPEACGRGFLAPVAEARNTYQSQNISRHFLGDDELLRFPDSSIYAVSNQWDKLRIDKFIAHARSALKFDIQESA